MGSNASRHFSYRRYLKLLAKIEIEVYLRHKSVSIPKTKKELNETYLMVYENLRNKLKSFEISYGPIEMSPFQPIHRIALENPNVSDLNIKKSIEKSFKIYKNTRELIAILYDYYVMFNYHYRIVERYPKIRRIVLKNITVIFSSIKRDILMELLDEVFNIPKLTSFYNGLYDVWKDEYELEEQRILNK